MVNSEDPKMIVASKKNWENLKNLGRAGDSFNDVLDKIFENKIIENKNESNLNFVKKNIGSAASMKED